MLWDNTPIQLFLKGGFAMWPLLACSILGLALILERIAVFWYYGGNFRRFVNRLKPLIRDRRLDDARAELSRWNFPVARVSEAFLEHLEIDHETRRELCEREGSEQIAVLENRLNWLAMLAQVAPMLGLLGTVTGLVSAFHAIELQGGVAQPADLASGIWEALITTVFGLVIAIPCMAAFHVLDGRLARTSVHMEWMISYLEQWLHMSPRSADRTREPAAMPE